MLKPRILLMDEPSMGLAPVLVEAIFAVIRSLNKQGTTILLVEQNALMALSVASRGYVLQNGRIVVSDTAEQPEEERDGAGGVFGCEINSLSTDCVDFRRLI